MNATPLFQLDTRSRELSESYYTGPHPIRALRRAATPLVRAVAAAARRRSVTPRPAGA
jgi:hypothetical protein